MNQLIQLAQKNVARRAAANSRLNQPGGSISSGQSPLTVQLTVMPLMYRIIPNPVTKTMVRKEVYISQESMVKSGNQGTNRPYCYIHVCSDNAKLLVLKLCAEIKVLNQVVDASSEISYFCHDSQLNSYFKNCNWIQWLQRWSSRVSTEQHG